MTQGCDFLKRGEAEAKMIVRNLIRKLEGYV
jgi:hypothetical protein